MRQHHFLLRFKEKYWRLGKVYRSGKRSLKLCAILSLLLLLLNLFSNIIWKLPHNAKQSIDGFLVLGGSIKREIYVAQLAKQSPNIPILISHGSDDPCIFLIFQREQAPLNNVWLEKCAESTFGNFFFSLPILNSWNIHKVKLITSATHLPRAEWLAKILLGSHGIAIELDIAQETGVPGNRESVWKTGLDLTRSFFWVLGSQLIKPSCSQVHQLLDIDMQMWQDKGFACERQAELEY